MDAAAPTLRAGESLQQYVARQNLPANEVPFAVRSLKALNPGIRDTAAPVDKDTSIRLPAGFKPGAERDNRSLLPPRGKATVDDLRAAADAFVPTNPAQVRNLQQLVGAAQDGVYGPDTERRVQRAQRGLTVPEPGRIDAATLQNLWGRERVVGPAAASAVRGPAGTVVDAPPADIQRAWNNVARGQQVLRPETLAASRDPHKMEIRSVNRLIAAATGVQPGAREGDSPAWARAQLRAFQADPQRNLRTQNGDLDLATFQALRAAREQRVQRNEAPAGATPYDAEIRRAVELATPYLRSRGVPDSVIQSIPRRAQAAMFQESDGGQARYNIKPNGAGAFGPLQATPIAMRDLAELRHPGLARMAHDVFGLGDGTEINPDRMTPAMRTQARLLERQRLDMTRRDNGVSPNIAASVLIYANWAVSTARHGGYDRPDFFARLERGYSGNARGYHERVSRFRSWLDFEGAGI